MVEDGPGVWFERFWMCKAAPFEFDNVDWQHPTVLSRIHCRDDAEPVGPLSEAELSVAVFGLQYEVIELRFF